MLRYLVVAAALCLAGCVTPLSAADQTPVLHYTPPDRTLVAVIDERAVVREGRPPTYAGVLRAMYGIPSDAGVDLLMFGTKEDRALTLAQLISKRMVAGLSAQGGDVRSIELPSELDDYGARALLEREQASRLMTMRLRDWHFDLNMSWVGRFQFNTDATVTVQTQAGTVMSEQYAERQAIQAQGDDSPVNQILLAYRAKMEQILNDPELRGALTAPPAPAAAAAETAPAEAAAGTPML